MLRELRLPDLGEGVTEGEVVQWLVAEGDAVEEDTPLAEVLTDKASVEIPSPYTGTIARLHVPAGTTVPVGTVLVSVEDGRAAAAAPAAAPAEPPRAAAPEDAVAVRRRVPALPSTRRLARDLGVDLTAVMPTGSRGRVSDADVVRAAGERPVPAPAEATAAQAQPGGTGSPHAEDHAGALTRSSVLMMPARSQDRRIPLRGVRRRIAEHLTAAAAVPTVTYVEEAEFDRIDTLRDRIVERDGVRLTYLPFIVLAACAAIRRVPIVNSTLDDAAGEIVVRGDINVGIATHTEEGLLVPVVHSADRMSVLELHHAVSDLASAARAGTLRPDQMRGSTFTVSSPGRFGGLMATPILNAPEAALLGVHRAEARPVVRDGAIVIRTIGNISLTFDHRVVDGVTAARFTQLIIDAIEEPALLLNVGGIAEG